MKKRNGEKHRRIFSICKEKKIFQSHQHRESCPCSQRKTRISKHLTVRLWPCIWRAYNRGLDSGVVSCSKWRHGVCTSYEETGNCICGHSYRAYRYTPGCTRVPIVHFSFHCLCKTVKIFLIFLTYEGWNFNSGNYLFTTDTK